MLKLVTIRELSIMTARQPPIAMPMLSFARDYSDDLGPSQCMVLRADGSLSQLDLDKGSERPIANGVERLWLSSNKVCSGKYHRTSKGSSVASEDERPWWLHFTNILWLYSATVGST